MFESITLKTSTPTNPLDIGYLAECLLFYDKTNILVDKTSLPKLFELCGVNEIHELIQRGVLSVQTRGNILGAGVRGNSFFVDLFSVTNADMHERAFHEAFLELFGKRGKARRYANKFISSTSSYIYDANVVQDIRTSISDEMFIKQIINNFLARMGIEKGLIGEKWFYEFNPIDNYSYTHRTNLNLEILKEISINKQIHFDFSPSSLLLELAESFGDIYIAESNKSEIFSTSHHSEIINLKFENVIKKATINRDKIDHFQKIALPKYRNLADIINSGERSYSDLIKLLDKAEKFKHWKNEIKSETDFIEEYSKAIESESWLDKMPSKIGRFMIFEGIGVVLDILGTGGLGTAVSTSLGVADSFLLDSFLKEWKPNQFVKGDFKKFVK